MSPLFCVLRVVLRHFTQLTSNLRQPSIIVTNNSIFVSRLSTLTMRYAATQLLHK